MIILPKNLSIRCILVLLIYTFTSLELNAQGTDLINAAAEGHTQRVRALIAEKADVNAKDKDGKTALMWASQKGHVEVVRALIEAKADVNVKSNDGLTALDMALQNKHKEVEILLRLERIRVVGEKLKEIEDVHKKINNDYDHFMNGLEEVNKNQQLRNKELSNKKGEDSSTISGNAVGQLKQVNTLIKRLGDKDEKIQKESSKSLVALGKDALKPLISALKDKNSLIRQNAASVLGEINDTSAIEPLIKTLHDQYWVVRLASISSLMTLSIDVFGEMRDTRAVEPVYSLLVDPKVRDFAAVVLGIFQDVRATNILVQVLKKESQIAPRPLAVDALNRILFDKHSQLRPEAKGALEIIIKGNIVDIIIAELESNEPTTRMTSAQILGEIKAKRSIKPLCALLNDEDENVRIAVKQSLKKIDQKLYASILLTSLKDNNIGTKINGAEELAALDPEMLESMKNSSAVATLTNALKDANPCVRSYTAEAIGKTKDTAAISSLIYALRDSISYVRWAAAEALGNIGEPASQILMQMLKDPDWKVQKGAMKALVKIGAAVPFQKVKDDSREDFVENANRISAQRDYISKAKK